MSVSGKEYIEQALVNERRTTDRQSLLKRLWQLNQLEPENNQEGVEDVPKGSRAEARSNANSGQ